MSVPMVSAIIFQILANGLEWWVALRVPALAVCKSAKQSVRNWGENGTCVSTMLSAHASAAAAVVHQLGGQPSP